ncbi:DNA primase subunit pri2 [Entomophthora muscae]|uniref:DNA primase subunit pri2 n=2 Tax=Entomophthora muscae TaxID=34485 RepID=A0ACC2TSE5_9FUNG|nr:DNA primase subunit pri2 [Entomophthora muscae]KAJ9077680.1 DNA primase subunit pri2 [Entomophthora muscae]
MYKQTPKRTLASGSDRNGIKKPNLTASAVTNSSFSGELNWYTEAPCEEISIEEFETFALDRLQVLKALEAATIRNKTPEEMCEIFQRVSRDHLPLAKISSNLDNEPILRKDLLSHFILRLAFCRSDELRRWFIKYESLLFK